MDKRWDITGYAMHSVAGTENDFNLGCRQGYTDSTQNIWAHCIEHSDIDEVGDLITETILRALSKANIVYDDQYTISLIVASNFFDNYFWETNLVKVGYDNCHWLRSLRESLNINGLIMCDSTACSSGGSAIVTACQLIDDRMSDVVIVLGIDMESEIPKCGMSRIGALAKTCISPFSKGRNGTNLADGIGCLIIENNAFAMKRNARIYAKIKGYGVISDAYNPTSPDPSGEALYLAMREAIDMGKVELHEISYINTHGSGTKLNDLLETQVIKKVFSDHAYDLFVNSSKSIIGHTLGAAGVLEAVITILQMSKSIIHPTANFIDRDDNCDLNYCFEGEQHHEVKYALSNSIGFGGINVCILLERGDYFA